MANFFDNDRDDKEKEKSTCYASRNSIFYYRYVIIL